MKVDDRTAFYIFFRVSFVGSVSGRWLLNCGHWFQFLPLDNRYYPRDGGSSGVDLCFGSLHIEMTRYKDVNH